MRSERNTRLRRKGTRVSVAARRARVRTGGGAAIVVIGLLTIAASSSQARGQCGSCSPYPAGLVCVDGAQNEIGGGPQTYLGLGGTYQMIHANQFTAAAGLLITHVCISVKSPTGGANEQAYINIYGSDTPFPTTPIHQEAFNITTPAGGGFQLVPINGGAGFAVIGNFWVGVYYPTATANIGHQGATTRTGPPGSAAVWVDHPLLGWDTYDGAGGPYAGRAPIIRPLHLAGALTEACCFSDGTCADMFPPDCVVQGGTPQGPGTDCATTPCETKIACCLSQDNACVILPVADCAALGGFQAPGGVCLGDANGNGIDDACEVITTPFAIEFSLDIGSDKELSDPFANGEEGFDPGDVYWWLGPPVTPPTVPCGRDGFKDDAILFGPDPFPDAPDCAVPAATRVPVGPCAPDCYSCYDSYFDLDGHDQLDVSLTDVIPQDGLENPIPIGPLNTKCVYPARYLILSYDDDMAPGWSLNDVPTIVPSPAGLTHGSALFRDEVLGVEVGPGPGIPLPLLSVSPFLHEVGLHLSLAPDPTPGEEKNDDDADSLDVVPTDYECAVWYFSADREAGMGLDPGGIYEVIPGGVTKVIDDQIHLGLPESTDVDAFEFIHFTNTAGGTSLALLFSVDQDDPCTPGDESGGLSPNVLYASLLTGASAPAVDFDFAGDIDAVAAWRAPLPGPTIPGDCSADELVGTADAVVLGECLSGPGGGLLGPGCACADLDLDLDVDLFDYGVFQSLFTGP